MTPTTTTHQRPPAASLHRRLPLLLFLLLLLLLYSLYTSKLLLNTQDCHSPTLSDSHKFLNQSEQIAAVKRRKPYEETQLKHVVFGIAASANLWKTRKEYIKLWWQPAARGVVWLDTNVTVADDDRDALPEIRISEDTSHLPYSHPQGSRAALRISRVVSETIRLGMPNVRWFVMGDDDTVFLVENVIRVLNKYDHRQFYYIGSSSESHIQNIVFSYAMAYGGGGFAISYPLARELEKIQDGCIKRYPALYGSDDRIQACMAELGVPLTKEVGFHQYDVYGNLLGLIGAHPITPLVSLHHLDVVDPIFPSMTRVEALQKLFHFAKYDSASIVQQAICYDKKRNWSIKISWGYVIQIIKGIMSPRELEMPTRTFLNWYKRADYTAYAFNTRPVARQPCQKPYLFYVSSMKYNEENQQIIGIYTFHHDTFPYCRWKAAHPDQIKSIIVIKRPDTERWKRSPKRDCCRVLPSGKESTLLLWVSGCGDGETSEL